MNEHELEALVSRFESCRLPRSEWSHARHLAVALWYLAHHPFEEAADRTRRGIQRLNQSHGNRTGYHETITLAWLEVVQRYRSRHDSSAPLAEVLDGLVAECGAGDYLLRFYSRELLMSDTARQRWVPPDLRPIA